MSTQEMLEEAISSYGSGDIRTLRLSRRRDKEVTKEQKDIYKAYKENNHASTICK